MNVSSEAIDISSLINVEGMAGDVSAQQIVNDIMSQLITTLEVSVEQQIDTLSISEKKIVQMTIDEAKTFQEQLAKSEKANKKSKIMKALGVIGTIIAAIMTVIAPSPMSVAMLVAAVAMTLEPIMADLMGYESVIEQMMQGIQKGMTEAFGKTGGLIATVLVMAAVAIGSATLATKFGAQLGTAACRQFTHVAEGLAKLKEMLMSGFRYLGNTRMLQNLKLEMTIAQENAVQRFFDAIQTGIVFAQSGVQIDYAIVKKAGAELMKELSIQGNEIGFWNDMVDMLKSDVQSSLHSRSLAWSVVF